MKRLVLAAIAALTVLTTPNTAKAEVLDIKDYGYDTDWYGDFKYDTETKTLTITDQKNCPILPSSWDVEHIVWKGTPSEVSVPGYTGNLTTLDVSEVNFSNCTELHLWYCPNLETVTGFDYEDLSTITEIHLGDTSISETPFPYKPGITYSFEGLGMKKLPFKWYYRPEDKAALLTDVGRIGFDGVQDVWGPLVTNENPLYDAVELTADMFNFPESIKRSELSYDPTTETYYCAGNGFSLKSGYEFCFNLDKIYNMAGGTVEFNIVGDGGVTSYGSICGLSLPYEDDISIEVTADKFNFPDEIKNSDINAADWNRFGYSEEYTGSEITLKPGYAFDYYVYVSGYDKNSVKLNIVGDGHITSYGSFVITLPLAQDLFEEDEDNSNDEVKDNSNDEVKDNNDEEVEVEEKAPEALAMNKTFTVGKNTYKVTKSSKTKGEVAFVGNKSSKEVTIPATVKFCNVTYKVTSIGSSALKNNTKVTKVTIGKNVQTIGSKAFYGCKKLKTVTIKSTKLTSVGNQAFQGCEKLTSITLPKTVKTIGKQAFYKCKALKTVTIKSTKLTSVGSKAFTGCSKKLTVKVPKSKYTKYKSLLTKAGVKTIKKF